MIFNLASLVALLASISRVNDKPVYDGWKCTKASHLRQFWDLAVRWLDCQQIIWICYGDRA